MEDLCWNCASPFHHRKDCDQPPNPALKAEIQKAYREGSGKEAITKTNPVRLEKWAKRQEASTMTTVPPVKYYKAEIGRLEQILYDLDNSKSRCPDPVGLVSANQMTRRLNKIQQLRKVMNQELNNIMVVVAMKMHYIGHDALSDEEELLSMRIDDLHENQKRLANNLFTLYIAIKGASSFLEKFEVALQSLQAYVDAGIEAYGGRPPDVPKIADQWGSKKEELVLIWQTLKKYRYLFPDAEYSILRDQIDQLHEGWRVLKSMKKEFEKELPRIVCKVCLERDVDRTIVGCGHTFCGICLRELAECAICRGDIRRVQRLYF